MRDPVTPVGDGSLGRPADEQDMDPTVIASLAAATATVLAALTRLVVAVRARRVDGSPEGL
jgi:hypothetical protein